MGLYFSICQWWVQIFQTIFFFAISHKIHFHLHQASGYSIFCGLGISGFVINNITQSNPFYSTRLFSHSNRVTAMAPHIHTHTQKGDGHETRRKKIKRRWKCICVHAFVWFFFFICQIPRTRNHHNNLCSINKFRQAEQ